MSRHIELGVEVNPIWAEFVADVLMEQIGCSGIVSEVFEYKDEQVISSTINMVKGYLWYDEKNPPDIEKIQNILWKNRENLIATGINEQNPGSWKLGVQEIKEEEWAHNWKKYWHPQKIGSKIIICPSWETCIINEGEIKIELDPGSAFGTGAHATTRLCILALEKYVKPGSTLVDVGTGSGILSVVGVKLGADKAEGVDNDPSVIDVAIENAQKNQVQDKCTFYEGTAGDIKDKYDIVTANILANVIISEMPNLAHLAKNQAKLIFSGIIRSKENDVKQAALSNGLAIVETLYEDDWVAIIAEKLV